MNKSDLHLQIWKGRKTTLCVNPDVCVKKTIEQLKVFSVAHRVSCFHDVQQSCKDDQRMVSELWYSYRSNETIIFAHVNLPDSSGSILSCSCCFPSHLKKWPLLYMSLCWNPELIDGFPFIYCWFCWIARCRAWRILPPLTLHSKAFSFQMYGWLTKFFFTVAM